MRPTTLTLVCGVVILLLHTGDAIGGGGENPPTPGDKKTTGPAVSAIIVMDPHLEGLTHNTLTDGSAKAKQASIRLQKGTAVSGSTFRIPSSFLFTMFGCDVTKTNVKWQTNIRAAGGSSAILVGDYIYRYGDPGMIRCYKAATGDLVYQERVNRLSVGASPVARISSPAGTRQSSLKARLLPSASNSSKVGSARESGTPAPARLRS